MRRPKLDQENKFNSTSTRRERDSKQPLCALTGTGEGENRHHFPHHHCRKKRGKEGQTVYYSILPPAKKRPACDCYEEGREKPLPYGRTGARRGKNEGSFLLPLHPEGGELWKYQGTLQSGRGKNSGRPNLRTGLQQVG